MKRFLGVVTLAAAMLAGPAIAESWTLDGENSQVAFGSIKKDTIGEVHAFEGLTGLVTDGKAEIAIDLATVQTNIDIRNERMIEHVFKNAAKATITAELDMDEVKSLEVGSSTVLDVEAMLSLIGTNVELEAEMFVLRLSENQVLVSTQNMVFLNAADAGISAGIDKLMELAKLPGITRTSPVTLRFIFNLDDQKAEAAPAASPTDVTLVAFEGDVKAGKKVFKKCKACHSVKEGKSGVGPSLYNVIGATAGQADGFSYSSAMADTGIVWSAETLTQLVRDPKTYIPGTKMAFAGLKNEDDITNLLAYLAEETAPE